MTDTAPQALAGLEQFAYKAALEWCGEKERETFPEDIAYFMHNWRSLPGLKARVERLALRSYLMSNSEGKE